MDVEVTSEQISSYTMGFRHGVKAGILKSESKQQAWRKAALFLFVVLLVVLLYVVYARQQGIDIECLPQSARGLRLIKGYAQNECTGYGRTRIYRFLRC